MHQPVLLKEVLEFLAPHAGGVYMDGSLGAGGYAQAILEAANPDGILLGFDIDEGSIHKTLKRLEPYGERFKCWHAGYHEALSTLGSTGIGQLNGIVLDLGLSSDQLENPDRGFSFRFAGPLDMRFNRSIEGSVEDLLNDVSEAELKKIISEYGEEPRAKKVAQWLKQAVRQGTLKTTEDLAETVFRALGRKKGRIHPATRVFQALRIAVNDELGNLQKGLEQLPSLLKQQGRLCIVSYHSLEDRMVKLAFKELAKDNSKWRILTRHPLRPSSEERFFNPRSRSAKMRVIEFL